jgi:hypothetical protein
VGEELRKQGKDDPARLVDQAAEQTEKVGSYLQERSPDELLRDIEDFGRQRPWAVLAGGMVLGIAAARFLKASSRDRYQQRARPQPSPRPVPAAAPPAPAMRPAQAPGAVAAPAGDPVAPGVGP